MKHFLWFTFLLSASYFPKPAASVCREGSETDCALNGICRKGQCVCDPGWKGERCNFLKLKPPSRLEPHGYYNGSMPTWGGDVIFENGKYHAFLTAKAYNEPPYDESDNYVCNTAIVRLEGPTPAGLFEFKEVVLPLYHHESHAIRAPDGTILIYMITYDGGNFTLSDLLSTECVFSYSHFPYNKSHEVIGVAWSNSVYGPWKEKIILNPWPGPSDRFSWLCQTNCPSVTFAPNGSVIMAFRSIQCNRTVPPGRNATREKIAIATAPHWSGPYTIRSEEPVFGWLPPEDWPSSLVTPGQTMANEDPFIWRTKRGYHMLTQCQLWPFKQTRGAYGFSKDGLTDWTLLPDLMWDTNMTWADGSVSYFTRRQAPDHILDKDGYPLYLLTPVDELNVDGSHWGHGWTVIQSVEH